VKRRVTEEEAALFAAAMRDVKPLRHQPKVLPQKKRRSARATFSRREQADVLRESLQGASQDPLVAAGDELVFRREGIQDDVIRKLRRGQYRVEREIDLHGMTALDAKQALRQFLAAAVLSQVRCVRIVHGKGLRSGHRGPVLKNTTAALLRRTGAVLAFVSARQVDGGTGAVYVLLE
jgi:DNA-nicking Smr family endonuclease